jgi:GT2 family glycosyltransferase
VVDNGSGDGSEERIREAFPPIEVVQTGANLGYAGGNNAGIQRALERGAELVWLVNNDTDIPSHCLTALVDTMSRCTSLGILGPTVLDPSTNVPEPLNLFPPGLQPPLPAEPSEHCLDDVELLDCAPGCSMLIRRGALEELDGLDTRYFHFFEDTDLCWRAWAAGWLVGRTCRVTIAHRAGSSTAGARPLTLYYMLRNLLLFAQKVTGLPVRVLLIRRPVLWLWALGPLFGLRSFRRPAIKLAVVRALIDASRGKSGRCSHYSPA